MPRQTVLSLVLAAAALIVAPGVAEGRTLVVGDGSASCPDGRYRTIQSAVDAARPGDEIPVCPGRYTESVGVDKRVKIFSRKRHAAVVQVGESGVGFGLDVASTLVRGFTVVPPEDASCSPSGQGIALSAVGIGTFEDNQIRGEGCRRFRDGVVSFSSDGPGSLYVVDNEISGFVNRGVFADSARVTANHNTIRGGRIGIVILQGDSAVQVNVVEGAGETGILADGLERSFFKLWLAGNRLKGNRDGIVVRNFGGGVGGPARIGLNVQANTVLDSVRDGLSDFDGFGLVSRNRSLGSGRFDCVGVSAARWKDNIGRTSSPANLCRAP